MVTESGSSSIVNMRRPLLGTSLKMYFNPNQTIKYLDDIKEVIKPYIQHVENQCEPISNPHYSNYPFPSLEFFVIPDFLSLREAALRFSYSTKGGDDDDENCNIFSGAQNCSWADNGAFTGEISPLHIKQIGCKFVELNHAERRRLFNETDETTIEKVKAVIKNSLVPLICIGEIDPVMSDCLDDDKKFTEIGKGAVDQFLPLVKKVLDIVPLENEVVFAYEPVWAIGKPEPADGFYIRAVVSALRNVIDSKPERILNVRIIYGGSAKPNLFNQLGHQVDGLFLGRFGHDIDNVKQIVSEVITHQTSQKLPGME